MHNRSILVVDDDRELRNLVADFLAGHHYAVSQAANVPEMREQMRIARFDLVILDVMMPGEDGLSALRGLERQARPPVIMLSALGSDVDRIVGLELGADDYLAKPCNPRELLARVRAVLRRAEGPGAPPALLFGGWRMDLGACELFAPGDVLVSTTPKEWRLLRVLAEARRTVLSRDELMTRIGGDGDESFDRAIDITISRLRRKLAAHDGREIIRTVPREGYGLALEVAQGGAG